MKKLLLSLTAMVALSQITTAQITITESNAPQAGFSTFRAEDEQPSSSYDFTATGTNHAWDFSMLNAYIASFSELDVIAASSVPVHGSSFPTADVAIFTSVDSNNLFIESNSSGMYAIGLGGFFVIEQYGLALSATLPFIDSQQLLAFPCTYGTTFEDTLFFDLFKDTLPELQGLADSARIKRFQTIDSEIDGWGVVTTPSMSAVACLREHRIEISVDSLWASAPALGFTFDTVAFVQNATEHVYNWYTEDNNLPVLEVRTDETGAINSVHWLANENDCCVDDAIEEHPAAKHFNLFPNPTSDNLNIYTTFKEETTVQLYDMTGKVIMDRSINQPQTSFDVSGLANGFYVCRILDNKGALIKAIKVQIQN